MTALTLEQREREIRDNLEAVKTRICEAARDAGRDPASVRLVAVTKNFPVTDIMALLKAGHRIAGENRVQELNDKIATFAASGAEQPEWHLIGTLQRNKVRHVVGEVALIHSVHSVRLLREIEKRSARDDRVTDVLLQVNISGEETKHGFTETTVEQALEQADEWPHVRLRGLMTMAPHFDDPARTRPIFAEARELARKLADRYGRPDFCELSMGMTNDYREAVLEGATIVRVGSAIFGSRY